MIRHPPRSPLFPSPPLSRSKSLNEPLPPPPPKLLKTYRSTKDWPAYEADFLAVMKERRVPASLDTTSWSPRVSLLCSEPGPEKCHRPLVADLLAGYCRGPGAPREIAHPPAPRHKRRNARHNIHCPPP